MDINFVTMISSVGFPIAVAAWCLTSLKSSIDKNTASNNAVRDVLITLCVKLDVKPPP